MISILGFRAVYFSIRKPTEDERHGARPPAVRMATFAYGSRGLARRGVGRCWDRAMAQIWARVCRPSAVNGMAACAVRLTRSRLPAALERAMGPRERCQRRAAAADMEEFRDLRLSSLFVANRSARTAETCRAVIAGSNRYLPASAACGIQSWLRLGLF